MRKWIFIILFSLLLIGGFVAYKLYAYIFLPNISTEDSTAIIHIPTGSSLTVLINTLSEGSIIEDTSSFRWVAEKMSFDSPKPGRFEIANKWSNRELIQHLRSGRQKPVKLTFNNIRKLDDLADFFGGHLESNAIDYYKAFTDSTQLQQLALTKEEMMSLFIPNTYEMYWNTNANELIQRMQKEYKRFWNSDRKLKASKIGLSPTEVYILASIVQKETNLEEEKPRVAGVYLNRLNRGILLQADPTVIFAVGDFEIRRVLNRHLEYDSPYNTYKYKGLPPGPIGMPDISTIDAVLNAEEHQYLYFCVSPGNTLKHAFAKTLAQHNANAKKYRTWLNKNRIYK